MIVATPDLLIVAVHEAPEPARLPAERPSLVDPDQVAPTLAVSRIANELLDGEPGINCVRFTVV
jgi:hypothetical protein